MGKDVEKMDMKWSGMFFAYRKRGKQVLKAVLQVLEPSNTASAVAGWRASRLIFIISVNSFM